jgi:hypothetical protein
MICQVVKVVCASMCVFGVCVCVCLGGGVFSVCICIVCMDAYKCVDECISMCEC